MWMYKLFFSSESDKKDAEFWIIHNVGYFEFDGCDGKEPHQLKFYTSARLPDSEQATIRRETRATSYLMEKL
jgi:hypothetical protein